MSRARSQAPATAPAWETSVLEAVGRVIEYWGFKRNHGRIWAMLYLGNEPHSAPSIGKRLGLSKGAVSIVLRELESWAVIRRVPAPGRSGVAYAAERDLWTMVRSVLRQRESRLVELVWRDLKDAEEAVLEDRRLELPQRREIASRIRRLRRLAELARGALDGLIRSCHLNLQPLRMVLTAPLRRHG